MSPRLPPSLSWCVLPSAALLLALGCGAPAEPGLGLELRMSQAVASEIGSFQVAVMAEDRTRSCADLQRTCLNQQVRSDELLQISGADKRPVRALRFTAALTGTAPASQQLNVDIPVGRKYVVVIEALSRASPPRFLGSSCNYLESVSATRNEPLIAAPITLATSNTCDPTFAP